MKIGNHIIEPEPAKRKRVFSSKFITGIEVIEGQEIDIGKKHLEGWRVFVDAGCWRIPYSPIGASYSFIIVPPSGKAFPIEPMIVTPEEIGEPGITAQNTELLGIIRGVRSAISQINGNRLTVCSDSKNALNWYAGLYDTRNVPLFIRQEMEATRYLVRQNKVILDYCLLAGHPNEGERKGSMERGYFVKASNIAYPVSEFNVMCDKACTEIMQQAFGTPQPTKKTRKKKQL